MTDTITESFCERCGTRYSFESTAKPRRAGFGRVRVLTKGLTTFVANDGMPLSEAMATARADQERAGTVRQLEAFHKTFNFCMSCRQYTCPNCWNEKAGECLTCAPDLSREVLPAPFPDLPAQGPVAEGNGRHEHEAADALVWPTVDLDRRAADAADALALTAAASSAESAAPSEPAAAEAPDAVEEPEVLARLDAFVGHPITSEELTDDELAEVEHALAASQPAPATEVEPAPAVDAAELVADAAGDAEVTAEAEPAADAAGDAEVIAEAGVLVEPVVEIATGIDAGPDVAPSSPAEPEDRAETARGQTRGLLGRFRPGRAAATAAAASDAAQAEPGPEVAPVLEPDTGASADAETAAQAAPPAEEQPMPPRPQTDVVEQPTWRVVAPDSAAPPAPAWPETPAWPESPQVPMPSTSQVPGGESSPWAARLAISRPEPTSVWAASSQEVLGAPIGQGHAAAAPGIQACVSCGLSLSANARFCRRCGTRQG